MGDVLSYVRAIASDVGGIGGIVGVIVSALLAAGLLVRMHDQTLRSRSVDAEFAKVGKNKDDYADDLREDLKAARQELRDLKAEMLDMRHEHRTEMTRMETEHRAEMTRMEADHRAELRALTNEHRAEMTSMQASRNTMFEKTVHMESSLNALSTRLANVEVERDRLRLERDAQAAMIGTMEQQILALQIGQATRTRPAEVAEDGTVTGVPIGTLIGPVDGSTT